MRHVQSIGEQVDDAKISPKGGVMGCANCDAPIGRLETTFVWNGSPVCGICHAKLRLGASSASPSAIGYVQHGRGGPGLDVASSEEHLVYRTTLHPLYAFFGSVVASLFLFVADVFIALALADSRIESNDIAKIFFGGLLVVLLPLLLAYIRYRNCDFVVTSRRITIKQGWLSRRTFEMLLSQVESIHVEQPIIDRIFGTGRVVIRGTGGSPEVFSGIRRAKEFRDVAADSISRFATRLLA